MCCMEFWGLTERRWFDGFEHAMVSEFVQVSQGSGRAFQSGGYFLIGALLWLPRCMAANGESS